MPRGLTRIAKNRDKPVRVDGRPWTDQMERAAQLKAQGRQWPAIAKALELSTNTVASYPSKYPPWDELVEWYRDKLWHAEVQDYLRDLPLAALGKLSELLTADLDSDDAPSAQAIIWAAQTALNATGFTESQKVRKRLAAQKDVTGEHGERVRVVEEKKDLEDMSLEELADLYDDTFNDE